MIQCSLALQVCVQYCRVGASSALTVKFVYRQLDESPPFPVTLEVLPVFVSRLSEVAVMRFSLQTW